ncbi:hypothetical protein V1525DRAFT_197763 [Lipomyces kononenkoae]|uniref:Uncharacterized protein n=1 Tax=Lipomyces kononenkoae TaxID=34357 RepID=A0ACC3SYG9_LIPKO
MCRGLACTGFPDDAGFIFRDENEVAQRNSERARRGPGENRMPPISFKIVPLHVSTDVPDLHLQQLYPWLNDCALDEVPRPLQRGLETLAVDRFFVNWTLHPCNDGVSPGHMHDLPMLYLSAPPKSILWLAVRAMAFADMRHLRSEDIPFPTKALRYYGAALSLLRRIAVDEQRLDDDRVLLALLLVDNFESMYLGRTEPLGPHSDAVRHILRARGDKQFFDRSGFSLWRAAHHRLQARQVMLREGPYPEQIVWLSKLDINSIPFHISVDVQQMNTFAAAAKNLTLDGEIAGPISSEKVEQARQLAQAIQDLISSIESWTAAVTDVWRPKTIDPPYISDTDDSSKFSIPHFTCPRVLSYHDIWLAYMWNFHAASQIILRESLVDVINYITSRQMQEPGLEDMERIQGEQDAVNRLSSILIRSFPQLLGFTHKNTSGPYLPAQGKMAGRYFSLFSMCVVQRARSTPPEHKQSASEVIEWINSTHGLG